MGGVNIDSSLIQPRNKTKNKILFVGKDFKRKGGYVTYEAFRLLREQGENVELYVAGQPQILFKTLPKVIIIWDW